MDSAQGYVTGASPGPPPSWGRDARPGTAQEFVYPGCNGKKVVADVLRLDKGHTEGLEPKVTEDGERTGRQATEVAVSAARRRARDAPRAIALPYRALGL